MRIALVPASRTQGYVQLGRLYATVARDPAQALESYRRALEVARPLELEDVKAQIPPEFWRPLGLSPSSGATTQTSVISK